MDLALCRVCVCVYRFEKDFGLKGKATEYLVD